MNISTIRSAALGLLLTSSFPAAAGTPVLYALNYIGDPGPGTIVELVSVNPDTGFVSVVGTLPSVAIGDLAVSPDGRVFTVSSDLITFSNPGVLYEIDVGSGAGLPAGFPLVVSRIGTDTGINYPIGLDFNSSGELFGIRDNFDGTADWVLYDIDTGVGTVLGAVGAFPPAGDVAFIEGFDGPGVVDTPFMSSFDVFGETFGRPPELVSNGGFDDGEDQATLVCPPTDWDCAGEAGATSSATGTALDSRNGFLAMTTPAGGGATFVFQDVSVTAGQAYTLSFDYSADGSGSTQFTAQCSGVVVFSESNGSFNPGWDAMDGSARVERTCEATSNTLRVTFTGGSGGTGYVGVDNVSVKETQTGKLVQLNPFSGAGTEVGDFGTFDLAFSLEYYDGRLIATDNDAGSNIYEIDPATAVPTLLSSPSLTVNLGDFAGYEPIETFFEYELDELSITGSGVSDYVDDYEDGVQTPSCLNTVSRFCAATRVKEQNGVLLFTNADGSSPLGLPFPPGSRTDAAGGLVITDESAGTLTVTSSWRDGFTAISNEPFGSSVQSDLTSASDDFLNLLSITVFLAKAADGSVKVYFASATTPFSGAGAGTTETYTDLLANALGFDTVTGATGNVVLELELDQATNQVTPRYSVDGGTTFVAYADWENNAGGLPTFTFNSVAPGFSIASAYGVGLPGDPDDPPPPDADAEQVPLPLAALLLTALALAGCGGLAARRRRR